MKRLYPGTPFLISATGIEGRTDKVQRGNALRAEIEKMKRNLAAPEYSSDESSDSTLGTSTVGSVTSSSSGLRETDSAPASPNSPYLMRRMNFFPTRYFYLLYYCAFKRQLTEVKSFHKKKDSFQFRILF